MMDFAKIAYIPPQLDILDKLDEEADLLRDDHSRASDEELADLLGEAAEEIWRMRKEIAEALYRNQEADTAITYCAKQLNRAESEREELGRARQAYQQCDSDRRDFAEECRVLRQERDDSRSEAQRLRTAMARIEELAAWPEAPWDVEIYDIARRAASRSTNQP